jgi:hypothetical protein
MSSSSSTSTFDFCHSSLVRRFCSHPLFRLLFFRLVHIFFFFFFFFCYKTRHTRSQFVCYSFFTLNFTFSARSARSPLTLCCLRHSLPHLPLSVDSLFTPLPFLSLLCCFNNNLVMADCLDHLLFPAFTPSPTPPQSNSIFSGSLSQRFVCLPTCTLAQFSLRFNSQVTSDPRHLPHSIFLSLTRSLPVGLYTPTTTSGQVLFDPFRPSLHGFCFNCVSRITASHSIIGRIQSYHSFFLSFKLLSDCFWRWTLGVALLFQFSHCSSFGLVFLVGHTSSADPTVHFRSKYRSSSSIVGAFH